MRFHHPMLAACAVVALCATARADGAFPNSSQILVPADQPRRIILGTNFGLVISDDDGATWKWICEEAIALGSGLYQVGAPPDDVLYGVGPGGVVYSRDDGCHWSHAAGAINNQRAVDVFPDPVDSSRVLALASLPSDQPQPPVGIFASSDGGQTFHDATFVAPSGNSLNGVEIARSSPSTIYATMYDQARIGGSAVLGSSDGGATFRTFDASNLGNTILRIAAVDPIASGRVYLRGITVGSADGDFLAMTDDGGQTVRSALVVGGVMSAFLRRADGTLLVGTSAGAGFRSGDDGRTFTSWPAAQRLRALAERNGRLYAAADNSTTFAVGVSDDGGAMWAPLLKFEGIAGPLDCPNIQTICAGPWLSLQATLGITPRPQPQANPVMSMATPPAPRGSGCDVAPAAAADTDGVALLLLAWGLVRARRAARRRD